MRDNISQAEFSAIVTEIMNRHGDICAFSILEKGISVTVSSRSRSDTVEIYYDFDDGGLITGCFSYAQTQVGSAFPQLLGQEIAECIKRMRTHQPDLLL